MTGGVPASAADGDPFPPQSPGTGPAALATMHGADGFTQALCTRIVDRAPVVRLLDGDGNVLAETEVVAGSLLGGVYAYLDEHDRMVLVDGNGDLLRTGHDRGGADGGWRLFAAQRTLSTKSSPSTEVSRAATA